MTLPKQLVAIETKLVVGEDVPFPFQFLQKVFGMTAALLQTSAGKSHGNNAALDMGLRAEDYGSRAGMVVMMIFRRARRPHPQT
jgi:hypothetical protein